jgi:hypothetical protein
MEQLPDLQNALCVLQANSPRMRAPQLALTAQAELLAVRGNSAATHAKLASILLLELLIVWIALQVKGQKMGPRFASTVTLDTTHLKRAR